MIDILMIIAGLVLLFFGGESLVKGAVSLAYHFGLSKLLVSTVVIGFGTSMPEMTVSIGAALKGASDIALGNVVGSNIANILLIIGLSAILCPLYVAGSGVKRDAFIMIGASLALSGLSFAGKISFFAGLALFTCLIIYILWSYVMEKKNQTTPIDESSLNASTVQLTYPKASVFCLTGLVMLIGGAYVLVEGAISIARGFGVTEAVIGLTIVAVGTSLPEMATSLVAAYKKQPDVIIGNIVGSNIFNILAILGLTAMVSPVPFGAQIAGLDVWIMLGVAVILSLYLLRNLTIGKLSGSIMVLFYGLYTFWLYGQGV